MSKLEEQIQKLRKALDSPATDEKFKPAMKAQLEKLEKQLADEKKAEEASKKDDDADDDDDDKKPAAKKKDAKKPTKPTMTKEDKDKCDALMAEIKALLRKHQGTRQPRTKKPNTRRVSTLVADKVFNSVAGAVRKEMGREKIGKVKVDKLRDVRDNGEKLLRSIRQALGGISTDNDGFIKHFSGLMNELISEVEKKQKKEKTES